MKRRVLLCAKLTVVATLCATGLFACGDGGTQKPPTDPAPMLAPYVVSLGDILYWEKIYGADSYAVYADGELIARVAENTFRTGGAGEYILVAENTAAGVKSKGSNAVTVYDRAIAAERTQVFDGDDVGFAEVKIPDKIDKVVVTGDMPAAFIIEDRQSDLLFELTDATIGGIRTADGSYSRFEHDYSVIFDINGTCEITGADGADGMSCIIEDSEISGGRGGDGCDGACVPSVIVRGSGNLTFVGGDGGRGGNGASASAWSGKHSGMGGSGGNGGSGVRTAFFLLDLTDGAVTAKNGGGGAKGDRGDNADIGTGFDEWFFGAQDGVNGVVGQSVLGHEIVLNGTLLKL